MPQLRVLVVDDHADTTELFCRLVAPLGHVTRAASTGEEALRIAEVFQPHAVLLDIGLPDMTGYDVVRELRGRGSHAYVVAVTGWGRAHDRTRALAAGFDDHVMKPVSREHLAGALEVAALRFGWKPKDGAS